MILTVELLAHVGLVVILASTFVKRYSFQHLFSHRSTAAQAIRIPTSFDPATFIYPTFLPVLVSLALVPSRPDILLPNIVLSLSSLPTGAISGFEYNFQHDCTPWMISLVPFTLAHRLNAGDNVRGAVDYNALTLLYPLHCTLVQLLHYLTTTSLLPSELHLLSTSLINVLLFSSSPQSTILRNIIWVGGIGLFVFCTYPLRWNVVLERIPTWRLRRNGTSKNPDKTTAVKPVSSSQHSNENAASSDGDSDGQLSSETTRKLENKGIPLLAKLSSAIPIALRRRLSFSAIEHGSPKDDAKSVANSIRPIFKNDVSSTQSHSSNLSNRKRRISSSAQAYLSMTPFQLELRKWLYAAYTFGIVGALILFIIRPLIAHTALHDYEPFGWAIGYLFGDLSLVRSFVYNKGLQDWIVLSDDIYESAIDQRDFGWVETLRRSTVGAANTRLFLFSYWLVIVSLGIATVLRLSALADVDTRRKVFHGMMVVMLLPTTFIDPAFLSLGLVLVLMVFLLLDLFRAAQLRPVSKPLARFLTPYIDGRDLQGPVIVSHIFLLIGCAIPLWLSLAGAERGGTNPWQGWEVATRDVSMIAGVVCVGMGDAAASLVGRRIGRHKWPWPGGKSLEGSAAFAAAVTAGLVLGKVWLEVGGWRLALDDGNDSWLTTLAKAGAAACGASFTEAVLTGCNDNVVVPIILWLLVRALQV